MSVSNIQSVGGIYPIGDTPTCPPNTQTLVNALTQVENSPTQANIGAFYGQAQGYISQLNTLANQPGANPDLKSLLQATSNWILNSDPPNTSGGNHGSYMNPLAAYPVMGQQYYGEVQLDGDIAAIQSVISTVSLYCPETVAQTPLLNASNLESVGGIQGVLSCQAGVSLAKVVRDNPSFYGQAGNLPPACSMIQNWLNEVDTQSGQSVIEGSEVVYQFSYSSYAKGDDASTLNNLQNQPQATVLGMSDAQLSTLSQDINQFITGTFP